MSFERLAFFLMAHCVRLLPARRGVPVLLYHRIGTASDRRNGYGCTDVRHFREQMDYLCDHGYYFASLDEVAAYAMGKADLPARTVAVTFDDGHQDNHTHAYPILKARGIRATIFLNTAYIGREVSHRDAYETRGLPSWGKNRGLKYTLLSWDQIREMRAGGMRFEAHGHSHRDLTALAPSGAAREMALSKTLLERSLGEPVRHLSYPYGRHDNGLCRVAERSGFAWAWVVHPRNVTPGADPYRLPRKSFEDRGMHRFLISVSGYDAVFPFMKRMLGGWGVKRPLAE